MWQYIVEKTRNNVDSIIALGVLIPSMFGVVYCLHYRMNLVFPIVTTLSPALYLILQNKRDVLSWSIPSKKGYARYSLCFCTILITSLITSMYFNIAYIYIALQLLSFCFFLLIAILFGPSKPFRLLTYLIVLISLIRATTYFAFPEVYGIDTIYHISLIQEVINSYILPDQGYLVNYSLYPIMHILSLELVTLPNVSLYFIFFSIGLIQSAVVVLFIYLLASKIGGRNDFVPVLSTYIFSISLGYLSTSISIIPNMFGLIYFVLLIYLAKDYIFHGKTVPKANNILFITSLLALLLTHPYPPIILLGILLISIVYFQALDRCFTKLHALILPITIGTLWLGYLTYCSFESHLKSFILNNLISIDQDISIISEVDSGSTDLLKSTIPYLSNYILVGFIVFGILNLLSSKYKKNVMLRSLAVVALLLLGIVDIVPTLIPDIIPIPYRIKPFYLVLGSICASYGIVSFSSKIAKNWSKFSQYIIAIIITIFCCSLVSCQVNPVYGIYSNELTMRNGITQGELNGYGFLGDLNLKNVYSDQFMYLYDKNARIDSGIINNRFDRSTEAFLIREYLLDSVYLRELSNLPEGRTDIYSHENLEIVFELWDKNVIYSNDDVRLYIARSW